MPDPDMSGKAAEVTPRRAAFEKLGRVLEDTPEVYECPVCGDLWVTSGRSCDHEEPARLVDAHALLRALCPNAP